MAGGKGGSQTSSVEIPEYIEAAAQRNLNKAERISQLGYVPYYGPDVAALTPMQQAAMQNVSGAASAFGMATPTGQDIYGMPAPTEYAGGIQGYSSAPMFEQAQAELAAQRPAQKSYIDSFFIDPFTGQYGSNVAPAIDYTQYQTMAAAQRDREAADRANELAIAQAQAGAGPQSISYFTTYGGDKDVAHYNIDQSFADYGEQIAAGTADPTENPAYNPDIAAANENVPITYQTDEGGTVTKPAGQLTSDDFIAASNDPMTQYRLAGASMAAAGIRNVGGGFAQDDPTTGLGGAITDAFGNIVETVAGLPLIGGLADAIDAPNSTYDPTGGGSDFLRPAATSPRPVLRPDDVGTPTATPTTTPAVEVEDLPGNVISRALNIGAGKKDESSDSGYVGESGDGCVVATHAVNSGAFTPSMKREAVVWCMHNLHDKWWGEAIRRGYRYLGRKKIEQGKAHEHYQEFRNYIDFASGKKRTIKGAIHFAARTVQFFAVGLVKGDA